ncbi:hypothetical protein ACIQ34_13470 [Ureibacillus sp. NPDC094379]
MELNFTGSMKFKIESVALEMNFIRAMKFKIRIKSNGNELHRGNEVQN